MSTRRMRLATLTGAAVLAGLGLAAALPVRVAAGQEASPPSAAQPARAAETRPLAMAVQAGAAATEAGLRAQWLAAVKATSGVECSQIRVESLTPEAYAALAAVVTDTPLATEPAAGDGYVEPLPAVAWAWRVVLGDPFAFLESLELIYGTGAGQEPKRLKPAGRSAVQAPLRFFSPGLYVLQLNGPDLPKSYRLTVHREGQAPETITASWPEADRYFLVTLENLRGDPQELYQALQDPQPMGQPVRHLVVHPAGGLVLVGFGRPAAREGVVVETNEVTVSLRAPRGASARRAWLLFPLSPSQLAGAQQELDAQVGEAPAKRLPQQLRQRGVTAEQTGRLEAESDPRWWEIPWVEDRQVFVRTLPLAEIDQWRARPDLAEVWGLVVYESEDPVQGRQALRIGHQYVRPWRLPGWTLPPPAPPGGP